MESYQLENIHIIPEKSGFQEFSKVSYPIRYGRFSEIQTTDYTFQFNSNGEIKYIQGRGQNWPHPGEWLKRTVGNDWLYNYNSVFLGLHDALMTETALIEFTALKAHQLYSGIYMVSKSFNQKPER